ncbi:hypothetical protein MKX01_015200 [Papaver californicum]|nr:hypothetical protein MKX01_015200 [Papaver californicum]
MANLIRCEAGKKDISTYVIAGQRFEGEAGLTACISSSCPKPEKTFRALLEMYNKRKLEDGTIYATNAKIISFSDEWFTISCLECEARFEKFDVMHGSISYFSRCFTCQPKCKPEERS